MNIKIFFRWRKEIYLASRWKNSAMHRLMHFVWIGHRAEEYTELGVDGESGAKGGDEIGADDPPPSRFLDEVRERALVPPPAAGTWLTMV